MNLRVLHVTNMWPDDVRPYYGAFVRSQVKSLERAGVACEVVYTSGAGIRKYHRIAKEAGNTILEFKPDVVHAHYGWTGAVVASLCARYSIPLVISYCGNDVYGGVGNVIKKLKDGLGVYASFAAGYVARNIIVKSEHMLSFLPSNLVRKTLVIPNGVNTDAFRIISKDVARKEIGFPNGKKIVLFGGTRKIPRKNFPLAQESIEILKKNLGDENIDLVVPDRIPHEQMPLWLNAADLVLLTSLKEGSPNIVKEALACGVPVVSVDVGDVRENLAGLNACQVCNYDPSCLAKAMASILRSPVNREELRGRIFKKGLDERSIARRLINVYQGAIKNSLSS